VELEDRRIMRAGDQTEWGLGVPSQYNTVSEQAIIGSAAEAAQSQLLGASRRGGGIGPFWHTPEDTLDKVDSEHLARDARFYAGTLWELCTAETLPFSYAAGVREMLDHVRRYAAESGGELDLEPVIDAGERLAGELDRLEAAADTDPAAYNRTLVELGRLLIPVNYTAAGRHDQDLALSVPPVPGLAGAGELAALEPGSPDYLIRLTELLRQRNRLASAFRAAAETTARGLERLVLGAGARGG
jgi:hypothetical protein